MPPLRLFRSLLLSAGSLFLISCAGEVASPLRSDAAARFAAPPRDRPGLGTRWGETRDSRVHEDTFDRADRKHPIALAAIYYNDASGIRAMAGTVSPQRTWPVIPDAAAKLVSVGLRDESGRFLPGLIVGDRWFVVGEEGRRYSIVLRNRSRMRLEAVLSVDGLDVIDGHKASLAKRGYVIEAGRQLAVDGFRRSTESVAAFRFSPVRESYAQEKYHNTRNVGVIGIALFNEAGQAPWPDDETRQRLKADPFPGRFAAPP